MCVCACVCVCVIEVCVCVCVCVYVCMCVRSVAQLCPALWYPIQRGVCVCVCMCTCVRCRGVCVCVFVCVFVQLLNRVQLFGTPWTVACQAPLSMGFFRQEYCSGLPLHPPRDLPNPRIEAASLTSPALEDGFFTTTKWAGC